MFEVLFSVLVFLAQFPSGGPTELEVALYFENGNDKIVIQNLSAKQHYVEITTEGEGTNYSFGQRIEPYQKVEYFLGSNRTGYRVTFDFYDVETFKVYRNYLQLSG